MNDLYPNSAAYTRQQAQAILDRIFDDRDQDRGQAKTEPLDNEVICPECQGDGFVSVGEGLFTCTHCHGERFVPATEYLQGE